MVRFVGLDVGRDYTAALKTLGDSVQSVTRFEAAFAAAGRDTANSAQAKAQALLSVAEKTIRGSMDEARALELVAAGNTKAAEGLRYIISNLGPAAAATENLTAAYRGVVASVDPAVAAQIRFDTSLASLRSSAAAAGISAAQLALDEAKLSAALSPAAIASREAAASLEKQAAAGKALVNAYAPLIAESDRLRANESQLNSARAAGTITAEQHAAALTGLHARQAAVSHEMTQQAGNARLSATQVQNLSHQLNDVVSGLAMGQEPMMILRQQGGQIVQALGPAIGYYAALAANVALVVGPVAALSAAWWMHHESLKAVSQAYVRQSGAIGISRTQLEQLAQTTAESGKISVREARAISAAVMTASQAPVAVLASIQGFSRDYAKAMTGGDIDKASSALADAYNDPIRAAKAWDAELNYLTDSQMHHIRVLTDQGRRTEAFAAAVDPLKGRLREVADSGVGYLGRAIEATTNALSNFLDAVGNVGKARTLGETLLAAQEKLNELTSSPVLTAIDSTGSLQAYRTANIAGIEKQIAAENALAAAKGETARRQTAIKDAGDIGRSLDPGQAEYQALVAKRAKLEAAIPAMKASPDLGSPAFHGEDTAQLRQMEQAYAAVTKAIKDFDSARATDGQKALLNADASKVASSMEPADRQKYLAVRQVEIGLMGQVKNASEAELLIKAAGVAADAQRTTAIGDATRALRIEASASADVAQAYAESESAGIRANAVRSAAIQASHLGAGAAQIQATAVATLARATADAFAEIERGQSAHAMEIDSAKAVAAAEMSGKEAMDAAADSYRAQQENATALATAQASLAQAVASGTADDIASARATVAAIEATTEARAKQIAQLRELNDLSQRRQSAALDISATAQAGTAGVAVREENLSFGKATGAVSASEEIAELHSIADERYAIKQKELADSLRVAGIDANEKKRINTELLALDRQRALDMTKIDHQASLNRMQEIKSWLEPLKSATHTMVQGFMQGTLTMQQMAARSAQAIAISYVSKFADIAMDWMVTKAVMDTATGTSQGAAAKAGSAVVGGSIVGGGGQAAAIAANTTALNALTVTLGGNTAATATGTAATVTDTATTATGTAATAADTVATTGNTTSLLGGFVTWLTGLFTNTAGEGVNTAAITANTTALAVNSTTQLVPFAAGSWSIPNDMPAFIHKDEMIVPAREAPAVRNLLTGGGPRAMPSSAIRAAIEGRGPSAVAELGAPMPHLASGRSSGGPGFGVSGSRYGMPSFLGRPIGGSAPATSNSVNNSRGDTIINLGGFTAQGRVSKADLIGHADTLSKIIAQAVRNGNKDALSLTRGGRA